MKDVKLGQAVQRRRLPIEAAEFFEAWMTLRNFLVRDDHFVTFIYGAEGRESPVRQAFDLIDEVLNLILNEERR